MDTPLQAAAKFHRAANKIERDNARKVLLAAKYLEAAIAAGNPKSLRNARRRGNSASRGAPVQLSVWTTKTPALLGGDARSVSGRGPWPLIEFDTPAHLIGFGRRKKAKRGFIRFSSGDVRLGPIAHPGTHGKHGFKKAWVAASPMVERIIYAGVQVDLHSTFGI